MSDERPAPGPSEDAPHAADADAWATACAEDLAAEKARRRARHTPPPGTAADELRRLMDGVADRLAGLQSPFLQAVAGPAAQQAVRQAVRQARAAVEPVVERNPEIFDHLAAAGSELLAAYRTAVQGQERRWTAGDTGNTPGTGPGPDDGPDPAGGPGERIDLD
ncbi:DUF5304 domain-containing protein [Streptomyces sp. J2-1]|uniref:DUF5304 domain-containing protein n=1 Tax=Streptomyces corallincola TaxID=2851888 RepID=UPI001C3914D0|nr:DUF5304 domain-containing protein [Streptomyces corallincola]MBV2355585.1 DUF5304 domain-containing protein [Streptomyces corallincola]